MITEPNDQQEEDRCTAGSECPKCGENRIDHLWWDEDGVYVTCDTCGHTYDPPQQLTGGKP
jgi:uncharacterized metal-binding protein (TIGR02443 family)